ncbi:hypothetical protein PVAG01_00789 [Phlyctema vagabunda]|uniref:Uncharacterized protein n=1 Tax=Phlyctema vagabunda TaxID=108571 RepID=A0ABR4PVL3_9HELO
MFSMASYYNPQHNVMAAPSAFGQYAYHDCSTPGPAHLSTVCPKHSGLHGAKCKARPDRLPTSSSRKPHKSKKHRKTSRTRHTRDGASNTCNRNGQPSEIETGQPFFDPYPGHGFHIMATGGPMHNCHCSHPQMVQCPNGGTVMNPGVSGLQYPFANNFYAQFEPHPFGDQIPEAFTRDEPADVQTHRQQLPTEHGYPAGSHENYVGMRPSPAGHGPSVGTPHREGSNQARQPVPRGTTSGTHNDAPRVHSRHRGLSNLILEGLGLSPRHDGHARGVVHPAAGPVGGLPQSPFNVQEMDRDRRPYRYARPYAETDNGDEEELFRTMEQVRLTEGPSRHSKRHR